MGNIVWRRLLLGLGSVIGKGGSLLNRVERAIWVCWVGWITRCPLGGYARGRYPDYQRCKEREKFCFHLLMLSQVLRKVKTRLEGLWSFKQKESRLELTRGGSLKGAYERAIPLWFLEGLCW